MGFDSKFLKSIVLIPILALSKMVLAVGGYSQTIIVNNQTDLSLSLRCKGGDKIVREKTINILPHRADFFLSVILSKKLDHRLGGQYLCVMSLGSIQNRHFKLALEHAEDIAVWTLNKDFDESGVISCQHELFLDFRKPSAIIKNLNLGLGYSGKVCASIDTDI